jgi:hypothetical protein
LRKKLGKGYGVERWRRRIRERKEVIAKGLKKYYSNVSQQRPLK